MDPDAPIRTLCVWCERYGRTPAVLVDVPLDARGVSHGICELCLDTVRAAWLQRLIDSAHNAR